MPGSVATLATWFSNFVDGRVGQQRVGDEHDARDPQRGGRREDRAPRDRASQVALEIRQAADDDRTRTLLQLLAEHKGPSGRAVEGAQETLKALAQARVDTFVVVDDTRDRRTAWFGHHPTEVAESREDLAAAGASAITPGPLIDVAMRAAVLTGAEIHVLRRGTPHAPAEEIGALCRFQAEGGDHAV